MTDSAETPSTEDPSHPMPEAPTTPPPAPPTSTAATPGAPADVQSDTGGVQPPADELDLLAAGTQPYTPQDGEA